MFNVPLFSLKKYIEFSTTKVSWQFLIGYFYLLFLITARSVRLRFFSTHHHIYIYIYTINPNSSCIKYSTYTPTTMYGVCRKCNVPYESKCIKTYFGGIFFLLLFTFFLVRCFLWSSLRYVITSRMGIYTA